MGITTTGTLLKEFATTSSETAVLTEFAVPDNAVTVLDIFVVCRAPSTGAGRRFLILAEAHRFNGGVPVVNMLKTTEIGASALANANAVVSVPVGATFSIGVQITGVAGVPLDWAIDGTMRFFAS